MNQRMVGALLDTVKNVGTRQNVFQGWVVWNVASK